MRNSGQRIETLRLIEQQNASAMKGSIKLKFYLLFEAVLSLADDKEPINESEVDTLMEVIARIYGWCGPDQQFFGRTLSNEEIGARRNR